MISFRELAGSYLGREKGDELIQALNSAQTEQERTTIMNAARRQHEELFDDLNLPEHRCQTPTAAQLKTVTDE